MHDGDGEAAAEPRIHVCEDADGERAEEEMEEFKRMFAESALPGST